MKKEILLLGYFREVIELCEKAGYFIKGIIDNHDPVDKNYYYIGNDDYVLEHNTDFNHLPIFMVPDTPNLRKCLYERYHEKGFIFETIVSPQAIVSKSASIGEGCMIQDWCNISANVQLGKMVRINSMANVMHDSKVGDFTTIAPSGVVLGRCSVGECAYIGANSTILPEITVGRHSIVGAGAVVTRSINDGVTVIGVPAKELVKKGKV